ncbi:alpha/beta hydrolase [bacterium]|nr:alpha/beta hydrolase [bacterium]
MVVGVLITGFALYGAASWYFAQKQKTAPFAPTHRDREGKGDRIFRPWRDTAGEFLGYFRAVERPRRIVVCFHGAKGEALDRAWLQEVVPARDLLVLAEYPGYGARAGALDDAQWVNQAERLVADARKQWGNLPVLAVGEDLGCSVAAGLASKGSVDLLALLSPAPSGGSVTPAVYRFFLGAAGQKNRFPVQDPLRTVRAPLHIVHGTLGSRVPLDHGKAVFEAYSGEKKRFEEVPGFDETNLNQALLHSPFTLRFREFLAQ